MYQELTSPGRIWNSVMNRQWAAGRWAPAAEEWWHTSGGLGQSLGLSKLKPKWDVHLPGTGK